MKKNDINWEITGLLDGLENEKRVPLHRILERIDYSLFTHANNYCIAPTVAAVFRGLANSLHPCEIISYVGPKLDVDAIVVKLNDLYGTSILNDLNGLLDGFPDTEKLTIDMVASHFVSRMMLAYDKHLEDKMDKTRDILSPGDRRSLEGL